MKSSFNLGVYVTLCCMGLLQDFVGKEEYVNFINNYWMNISWQWWLLPMTLFIVQHWFNEKCNKEILRTLFNRTEPKDPGFPDDPVNGQTFIKSVPTKFCFDEQVGAWLICGQEIDKTKITDAPVNDVPVELAKESIPEENDIKQTIAIEVEKEKYRCINILKQYGITTAPHNTANIRNILSKAIRAIDPKIKEVDFTRG